MYNFFPSKWGPIKFHRKGRGCGNQTINREKQKKCCFHFNSAVNYTYDVRELKKDNLWSPLGGNRKRRGFGNHKQQSLKIFTTLLAWKWSFQFTNIICLIRGTTETITFFFIFIFISPHWLLYKLSDRETGRGVVTSIDWRMPVDRISGDAVNMERGISLHLWTHFISKSAKRKHSSVKKDWETTWEGYQPPEEAAEVAVNTPGELASLTVAS